MPPLVERAVLWHPAQSESVKVVIWLGSACQANILIILGAPLRYLPIFTINLMCDSRGELMARADSFTAYPMSGLSGAM